MNDNFEFEKAQSRPKKQDDTLVVAQEIGKAIAREVLNQSKPQTETKENATSISLEINKRVQEKASRQASFAAKIAKDMTEKKNCAMFSIGKAYREYAPKVTVTINGCTVTLPANGQEYLVHDVYITEFKRFIQRLDDKIDQMNKGSFITEYTR